jgi:signal transduction histidine kinase
MEHQVNDGVSAARGARPEQLAATWLATWPTELAVRTASSTDCSSSEANRAAAATHIFEDIAKAMQAVSPHLLDPAALPAPGTPDAARRLVHLCRDQHGASDHVWHAFGTLAAVLRDAALGDAAGAIAAIGRDGVPDDLSDATWLAIASTERLLAQLAREVAEVVAEEAARERRDLSGTVEVFTRTLAHEIKNPLGAAAGAAQMILDDVIGSDEAQRQRFAELITRNVRRATELVNDLRALVAIRAGGDRPPRPQPLRCIVDDVLHEVEGAADEQGVVLAVAEPLPEATVDGARVSLILMNLTWNAIKYADRDKPERWVRIGARLDASGTLSCFVADNGLGIPEAEQARIFERYQRAHPDAAPGTGLGLSIARESVEQLGGHIWVESEVGLGSSFSFTINALV